MPANRGAEDAANAQADWNAFLGKWNSAQAMTNAKTSASALAAQLQDYSMAARGAQGNRGLALAKAGNLAYQTPSGRSSMMNTDYSETVAAGADVDTQLASGEAAILADVWDALDALGVSINYTTTSGRQRGSSPYGRDTFNESAYDAIIAHLTQDFNDKTTELATLNGRVADLYRIATSGNNQYTAAERENANREYKIIARQQIPALLASTTAAEELLGEATAAMTTEVKTSLASLAEVSADVANIQSAVNSLVGDSPVQASKAMMHTTGSDFYNASVVMEQLEVGRQRLRNQGFTNITNLLGESVMADSSVDFAYEMRDAELESIRWQTAQTYLGYAMGAVGFGLQLAALA